MKKAFFAVLIVLLLASFASADVIMDPSTKAVPIENKITNLANFPDYVFFSIGSFVTTRTETGMCPPKIIEPDGIVKSYYKLCSVSVFAVKKGNLNSNSKPEEFWNAINEGNAVEVLNGLRTTRSELVISPTEKITNYFSISIGSVKTIPDKSEGGFDWFLYVLIPIIAVIAILFIVLKRRKK